VKEYYPHTQRRHFSAPQTHDTPAMTLSNVHYVATAFGLTVWTHAPGTIMGLVFLFQGILYEADIDVPDYDDFIFWQMLATLGGVLVGWVLLLVTRAPRMLVFQVSYVGVWGQFVLWLVFFLAVQLLYAFFPPPTWPWGVIGLCVGHLFVQGVLWWVVQYNTIVFDRYRHRKYFFGLWTLVLFAMEAAFFLRYVLIDRWTAYVAIGIGAAIIALAALIFPVREPYSSASPSGGEPLIGPAPPMVYGDKADEEY
jgi:hypothetical protein